MSKNIKTVPSFFVDVSLERNKNTISVFNLTLGQTKGFVTFVWGDRSSCYPHPGSCKSRRNISTFTVLEFTIWVWSESLPSKKEVLAHCSGYSRHRCWHNNWNLFLCSFDPATDDKFSNSNYYSKIFIAALESVHSCLGSKLLFHLHIGLKQQFL